MSDGQGAAAAAAGAAGAAGGEAGGAAGAQAGGGAADLLNGDAAGGQAEGGAGAGGGTAAGSDGGTPWYATLSDKPAEGQSLSDKAWLENKKYSDVGALVKATRELESRFLAGDKIVMPKEGDPPEAHETFFKAIGRPDNAEGYEIKLPEGRELDEGFAAKMREVAFKAGVPAQMFGPMAEAFNQHMIEVEQNLMAQRAQAKSEGLAKIRTEWGNNFDAHLQQANQAMRMLGLDKESIAGIEDGLEEKFPGEGTMRTLKLLQKLGSGMGEDSLIDPANPKVFGVTPAAAREELKNMNKQPGIIDKLKSDPALKARREMLTQIVAAEEERQKRG